MLMGEFQHAIDAKGRLFIPARLREELGERFIVTRGLENCLFVYPLKEWAALEEKLRALPFTRAEARGFQRLFFSGATECELDKLGRILLPAHLREYAGLEKDAILIGVSTRVEVWSLAGWQAYSERIRDNYAELAEKLELA
ncbi:MAG: transcriptional regulator MraZ [Clostridia bacterium]|nr:MAG: transcriptional regulator MraZ [Clostridia bacterium]